GATKLLLEKTVIGMQSSSALTRELQEAYNYRKSSAVIQYASFARTEGGMWPGYRASEGCYLLSGPSPKNMESYGNEKFEQVRC
ncbi:unnamed protein product, partial [Laminaria digitata]